MELKKILKGPNCNNRNQTNEVCRNQKISSATK